MFGFFYIFYLWETTVAGFILIVLSATYKVFPDIYLHYARVLIWLRQSHRRMLILWCLVITAGIYRILLSTVFMQLSFQCLKILLITTLAITLDRIRRSSTNDFIGAPILS